MEPNRDINEVTYDKGAPFPSTTTALVEGVPVTKYDRDIKKAKTGSFIKGFLTSLVLTLLAAGGLYLASGFGDQNRYQLTEPDFSLPTLQDDVLDDVIEEEGNVDAGNAEVETVDQ